MNNVTETPENTLTSDDEHDCMLTLRRYNLTLRKLIDLVYGMSDDERGLLLKEAQKIKAKVRATRRKCTIPVLLHYAEGVHAGTVTDLSFRGAFVDCLVPVIIGDPIQLKFKNTPGMGDLTIEGRIVHAASWGIGIRFTIVKSRTARFLQKCLDDARQPATVAPLQPDPPPQAPPEK